MNRMVAIAARNCAVFLFLVCASFAHGSVTLKLAPAFASVGVHKSQQFTATVSGETGAIVTWKVNSIAGGDAVLGTISKTGLYTAPAAIPPGTTVTIAASVPGVEPISSIVAITAGKPFYVSTTGKDTNPGTLAEPWRTLLHAANEAIAGDTVYARAGTYRESVNLPHSGSAAAGSIVFTSYPGELAIVDGTGVSCCGDQIQGLFNITGNQSYIIIEGLAIQNYTSNNVGNEPAGIYVSGSGSYIQILNSTVRNITETAGPSGNAHGIGFYGTFATPLSNITLSGNDVYGMKTGNSETITLDGNVVGFTVTGNIVHDNDNIGIDATGFYGTGPSGHDQASKGEISANTVYNITSIKNPAYSGYGADGIYCDGCTQVTIERNLTYDCDLNIEAASENPHRVTSAVIIRDNIVYGGNLAGISIGGYQASVGGSDHITIFNNTLFDNNVVNGGGDFQIQFHATNSLFVNNIVYSGPQGIMLNSDTNSEPDPVILDYNLYYTAAPPQWTWQNIQYDSFNAYRKASKQDQHSYFENPELVSAKSPYNFDLEAASPARNKGNFALGAEYYGAFDFAGNPRTAGGKINIGAYQQ